MSDSELFTPFQPALAGATASEPETKRRGRKPRATKPAPVAPEVEKPPQETKRRRRVANVRKPAGLKLPVATVLAAVGDLRADDAAVFEKLLGILSAAAKGQRQRVLRALGKVFA